MKKLFIVIILCFTGMTIPAFAAQLSDGLAVDSDTIRSLKPNAKLPSALLKSISPFEEIKPSLSFKYAEHVINGVALRNRTSGTIALRGVPLRNKLISAYLYWNYSNAAFIGKKKVPILINGNRVNGEKTADNSNLCWVNAGNHTYRADVTAYIPTTRPNNDYVITTQFDELTSTTGQDPWAPIEMQNVRVNGAWLVVVYRTPDTTSNVFIYDSLSNTDFSGSLSLTLYHSPLFGNGLFSMGGVDGQRGFSHTNFASNETSWFNGIQIAGPPVAASDWDGSDGLPLPQLSDTHTHNVRLDNTFSSVRYIAGGDCLAPTVFVIEGQ